MRKTYFRERILSCGHEIYIKLYRYVNGSLTSIKQYNYYENYDKTKLAIFHAAKIKKHWWSTGLV